jgi:hypothetical protein
LFHKIDVRCIPSLSVQITLKKLESNLCSNLLDIRAMMILENY